MRTRVLLPVPAAVAVAVVLTGFTGPVSAQTSMVPNDSAQDARLDQNGT